MRLDNLPAHSHLELQTSDFKLPKMIFPIRSFGDPVLRMPATPVKDIDTGVRRLVDDMIETMYDAPGVGLAAPQIGVPRAVLVFDIQDGQGARVLINPDLVETWGEFEYDEGCLSVPGYFWPIVRPAFARARGLDLEGNEVVARRSTAPDGWLLARSRLRVWADCHRAGQARTGRSGVGG